MKKDAVPSVFTFRLDSDIVSPRAQRMQSRQKAPAESAFSSALDQGIQQDVEIESESLPKTEDDIDASEGEPSSKEVEIQCELLGRHSIEDYINKPKSVLFYIGFNSYEHFMLLFQILGPAAYELNYKCSSLHPSDQLFLTLIKLRCAKGDVELSLMFEISESTVSRIFNTWVNFLYFQLKELEMWPSREVVNDFMPQDFKQKFPTTRIILDATEMPI